MRLAPAAAVVLTWRDGSRSSATVRLWLPSSTPPLAAFAAAERVAARLAPLTGCALIRVAVTYASEQQPFIRPDGPAADTGVLIFRAAGGEYGIVAVPDVLAALVQQRPAGNGVELRQDAPAVAALVAALVAGPWCNPFGQQLLELKAAYLQERQ